MNFKKLILAIILMCVMQVSKAQVLISLLLGDKLNSDKIEFGLDGGFNFSNISNLESSDRLSALNLGFYFDIKMGERVYLNTGVLVKSTVGNDELTSNDVSILAPNLDQEQGTYSQRLSYFHVPITMKYRLPNNLYFKIGSQLGLLNNAQVELDAEDGATVINKQTENMDQFKRIEAGVVGGIGYKLRKGTGMNIGVKYYQGLTNIYKADALSGTNNGIYLKVDIPIGVGKAKEG